MNSRVWWGLFLCMILASCDSNISYSKVESIPNQLWYYKDSLRYEAEIKQPLTAQDVVLSIRNTYSYPYQNLYLKIMITDPSGNKLSDDTLQLYLADKLGNWKGAGLGQMRLNEMIIKSNYSFQDTGKYVISVRHLMRDDYLPGIEDIALSFQKNGTVQLKGTAHSNGDTSAESDINQEKNVAL